MSSALKCTPMSSALTRVQLSVRNPSQRKCILMDLKSIPMSSARTCLRLIVRNPSQRKGNLMDLKCIPMNPDQARLQLIVRNPSGFTCVVRVSYNELQTGPS